MGTREVVVSGGHPPIELSDRKVNQMLGHSYVASTSTILKKRAEIALALLFCPLKSLIISCWNLWAKLKI